MNRDHEDGADVRVEAEFDVPSSPEAAWAALEQLRAERADPASDPTTWWLPGFECRATELEHEPGRRLTVRKAEQPCEGTTISITFEHQPSGSRIHVVQSGFDPEFVRRAGEQFWAHGAMLVAGVEAFFRGVQDASGVGSGTP